MSRNPLRSIQNKPGEWKQRSTNDIPSAKRRQTISNSGKPKSNAPRASYAPNPRTSLAPNAVAASSRTSLAPNIAPRASLAPNSSLSMRRQSSIGGRFQGKGNDAKKQSDANIRKIIEFLSSRKYPSTVTFKMLSQPTVKDFQDITIFLIRVIDPGYEWKSAPEDEIPKFFKQIHCPFSLNKSSLRSVGSIATWPSVLQALGWLVDLLNYSLVEQETRFQSEDDLHQKLFFDFLTVTYQQFLQGKSEYDELENELSDFFSERNEQVRESIADIQEENEQLLAEIQKLQKEKQKIPQIKKDLAHLDSDSRNLKLKVKEWEVHEAQIRERNSVLSEKLSEANEALENAQTEQQLVLAKLDKQEMKSEDVQRLYAERSGLQQELQLVMKHHQSLQAQSTELEKQLQILFENVQPLLRNYNQSATNLKLIPSTAKYADGFQFEINVRPRDLHDDSYTIEIKKDVKLNIMKLRENFKVKLAEYDEKRIQLQHMVEQESEKLIDKQEEAAENQTQLEEALLVVENLKQQVVDEYQTFQNKVSTMREKYKQLERTSQEELADSVQLYQTLEKQFSREQKALQDIKDAQIAKYHDTCTAIMNHKEYMKQRLDLMSHNIKRELFSE